MGKLFGYIKCYLHRPTNPGFRGMYLYHQDTSHKTTAAVNLLVYLIPRIPRHITEILRTEATK
jgi:hypothetical protein